MLGGEAQESSGASEASARRGERGRRLEQQAGRKPFVADAGVPVGYIAVKQSISREREREYTIVHSVKERE